MIPGQNPRPRLMARVPVKTPDNSMLEANHTVKFRHDDPYLSLTGMGAIPWTSMVRSPCRLGREPSYTLTSAMCF